MSTLIGRETISGILLDYYECNTVVLALDEAIRNYTEAIEYLAGAKHAKAVERRSYLESSLRHAQQLRQLVHDQALKLGAPR